VGSSRDEGVEGVHKGWTGIRKSEMKEVFVHELECRVDTSEIQSSGRRSEEVVAHESLLRCKVVTADGDTIRYAIPKTLNSASIYSILFIHE